MARASSSGALVDIKVGDALRRRRLLREMTWEQLAGAADVSIAALAEYEAGRTRPPAERLMRILRALAVSPAAFFRDID